MSDTTFHFTLRFDNAEHSLTNYNGLPLGEVAVLLKNLAEIINNDKSLVLSDVRGNCYALQISTKNETTFTTLKTVHTAISENRLGTLRNKEYDYAKYLKTVLIKNKFQANAYDAQKTFDVPIKEITLLKEPTHYYEVGSIYGIVTGIGSKDLDGKITIQVSQQGKKIEITAMQERALLPYYKKQRMTFYVRKKINFQTEEIESIVLEDFEVAETNNTFLGVLTAIKAENSNGLFNDIPNSADAVRALRNE